MEAPVCADLPRWLEYIARQSWLDIDMGLDRMAIMVERMGLAQPARKVLTVAGTNGKGSTCMAAEALALASGLRVGATLSPHVVRINERVRLNGAEVGDTELCAAFAAVEAQRDDLPLTYFEYSVLATLYLFVQQPLDLAILEIGLGGRLDAFNIIDADVAVVTSIGLDHQAILGETREAIGAEKAGIFRAGQRVVLGADMPDSVLGACRALGMVPLHQERDAAVSHHPDQTWSLTLEGGQQLANLPLGTCAPSNIAMAALALQEIADVTRLAEVAGQIRLPGRLQRVEWCGRTLWLDVAHNPDGVSFLSEQMALRGIQPDLICCAMLKDKDHLGVKNAMTAYTQAPWLLTDSFGERSYPAVDLATSMNMEATCPTVDQDLGVWETLRSASKEGDVILAFGSFSIVEQLLSTPSADKLPASG